MFCPKCKAEYREGYTICSDCKIPLVKELHPESKPEYRKLYEVFSTNNINEAEFVKSVFVANNIDCFIQNTYTASVISENLAIPIKLMVEKKNEEQAKDIVVQYYKDKKVGK
ncbi:MAG: DUF2007 domain-containing protein [Elusimicrobiota bacterium]